MKIILKTLCVLAFLCATTLPGYAADKTIQMGTMTWEDLVPITKVTKHVLEAEGFNVEVTQFSNWGIAFAALRKGDIQILAAQINYAAHSPWKRYKAYLEKISPVSYGLYQAFAVPSYVDIDSITQLNAHAQKFGGRIIGIEPGSGLMKHAAQAVEAYDLKLELVGGSTPAMIAALKSAVARKDWIVVALWDPTWMYQKFDMKFLKDPKSVFAPPQAYYWIAHEGFSEKHPKAREVIASVYLPLAANRAINTMVRNGKSMDAAVNTWLQNHKERVERWQVN